MVYVCAVCHALYFQGFFTITFSVYTQNFPYPNQINEYVAINLIFYMDSNIYIFIETKSKKENRE